MNIENNVTLFAAVAQISVLTEIQPTPTSLQGESQMSKCVITVYQKVFLLNTTQWLLTECAVFLSWHYSWVVTNQQTEMEDEYVYFALNNHTIMICTL